MSLKSRDWLGLGLGGLALAGASGMFSGGGSTPSTQTELMNSRGMTTPNQNTALLNSYNSGGDVQSVYDGFGVTSADNTTSGSFMDSLKGFGTSASDFLGSDAGKNTVAFAAPVVSGLIGASATDKAAEMQADTYAKQLAADKVRIDADNARRNRASLAMASGFSGSGLGA